MKKKEPTNTEKPSLDKIPQSIEEDVIRQKPSWRFGKMDYDGQWGWKNIETSAVLERIQSKLKNFESMTWGEIIGKQNHPIKVADISVKAKKRLNEIKMDDIDELFSLHLTGKERMWGIKDSAILYVLWWDPDHTVYKVQKRHT